MAARRFSLPAMQREQVIAAVDQALAEQLGMSTQDVDAAASQGLDALGLDSHGLVRVLLAIEQALNLEQELDVPDEALESPATLRAGVCSAVM